MWRIECTYFCRQDAKRHQVIIKRRHNPAEMTPPICPDPYDLWLSE